MTRRVVAAVVLVIVLIVAAVAVGGIGYRIGVMQGLSANPALVAPQGSGGAPVVPFAYRAPFFYGGPWGWGGGFGFLGCLFPLLGFLLIFFLIRAMFWHGGGGWRRGWGGWGGHGYGPGGQDFGPGGQGVPPMFAEWHNRAHGNPATPQQPQGPSAESPKQ